MQKDLYAFRKYERTKNDQNIQNLPVPYFVSNDAYSSILNFCHLCIADKLLLVVLASRHLESCRDMLTVLTAPRQCSVEGFRRLLNVECDTAIVVANLIGVCGFVIIMCISIIIIKKRYALNFYKSLAVVFIVSIKMNLLFCLSDEISLHVLVTVSES